MLHIRLLTCALTLLVTLPIAANAQQPSIDADGIRNGASYALSGMPNAGIAQGSIFIGWVQTGHEIGMIFFQRRDRNG